MSLHYGMIFSMLAVFKPVFKSSFSFLILYGKNVIAHITLDKSAIEINVYISSQTYVVGTRLKRLYAALLMSNHNMCFCGDMSTTTFCFCRETNKNNNSFE